MSPVIRVNETTFENLRVIASWLKKDKPSEALEVAVQKTMESLDLESDSGLEETVAEAESENRILAFQKTPNLYFTRLLKASVNGQPVQKLRWVYLLSNVVQAVKDKGLSGQSLVDELQIPAKVSKYNKDGYKYHPELGISIQNQAAPDSWREAARLAKKHKIPVEIQFQWRENKKAQHPGQIGALKAGA